MITFWADAPGSFGIREYLQLRGQPIANRFSVRHYEDLRSEVVLAGGGHIFSALDQLTPTGRELIADLHDRVAEAAPSWTLLNHPRRVLLREAFLQAMWTAGLNTFRVHPASADPQHVRYPVFLREANRHDGPLTGLLESPGEVRSALRALLVRGRRRKNLLIIEYEHASDERGRFRKYSAYKVGKAIVRTHLMFGAGWSVKSGTRETDMETETEAAEYLRGTLHEEWLEQTFDLAGIDYGRIDYGVAGGRPQAWEINLNPTLGRRLGKPRSPAPPDIEAIREAARIDKHRRLREAFLALDRGLAPEEVRITLQADLLQAVRREWRGAERRQRATDLARRVFHSPLLGAPARAVYKRVFQRS